jgi:hypothetical protein
MADLLTSAELPQGFVYPNNLVRAIDLGLKDFDLWWIFEGDLLRGRLSGLKKRYPTRRLVPFAKRQDNDDIACFDLDNGKISVIHDFASPGWEQRGEGRIFDTFEDWLRQAIEDMLAFE